MTTSLWTANKRKEEGLQQEEGREDVRKVRLNCLLSLCLLGMIGFFGCKQNTKPCTSATPDHPVASSVRGFRSLGKTPTAPSQPSTTHRVGIHYTLHPIHPRIAPSPQMEALIRPYRVQLKQKMAEVLATAPIPLTRQKPNGTLGNLITDLALAQLRHLGYPVDVFVTNAGGIRNDLSKGPVTRGDIFESIPFENALIVVSVTGRQLQSIFNMLAKRGGEPIGGARFLIDGQTHKATQVYIGNAPLNPRKRYLLGSSDYLAKTGFLKPYLRKRSLQLTELLLRDAVIWGLKSTTIIQTTRADGRIQLQEGKKK